MNNFPLASRRILVTRAAYQAGKLSKALRAAGAEPVEVPVLEFRPPTSYDPLDNALRQLDSYQWLIFTSANAVRVIAQRSAVLGINIAASPSVKIAAVGASTASAVQEAGLLVTVVPESYVAESLILALKGEVSGQRTLLARAATARDILPDSLREMGAQVDVVDAYRSVLPESAPDRLCQALAEGIDAVTFTSSSSVTHLAKAAQMAGMAFPFPGVPAVSIGPITSRTLRDSGWAPAAEASPSDLQGLVTAVLSLFAVR